jgi:hypothetical protein
MIRHLLALAFAIGSGAVLWIGQPLDAYDLGAAGVLLFVAGVLVDPTMIRELVGRAADKYLGPKA